MFSLAVHRDIMQPHNLLPRERHVATRKWARHGLISHMNATVSGSVVRALEPLRAEMRLSQGAVMIWEMCRGPQTPR